MGQALARCGRCGAEDDTPQWPSPSPPRRPPQPPAAPAPIRAKRDFPPGSTRELLRVHVRVRLETVSSDEAIVPPAGADLGMWVEVHYVDFVNELAMLFELVSRDCQSNCGQMSAGKRRLYTWDDDEVLSARAYCQRTLTGAAELCSSAAFPEEEGEPYTSDFWRAMLLVFRRLLRVYAHLYHDHFGKFAKLGCHGDVNELFRRFALFGLRFELLDVAEFDPLAELAANLRILPAKPAPPPPKQGSLDSLAYSDMESPKSRKQQNLVDGFHEHGASRGGNSPRAAFSEINDDENGEYFDDPTEENPAPSSRPGDSGRALL